MPGKRVLIVVRDEAAASRLDRILTSLGYQTVATIASGEEAVERAPSLKPDVILMDIQLGGQLNGVQAAQRIQTVLDVPVVYLSAPTAAQLLAQAKTTQTYGFLGKPVRARHLRASLEVALHKHATDRHSRRLYSVLLAIRDVNQLITRERNPQTLLDEACRIIKRAQGYLLVWIAYREEAPLSWRVRAIAGEAEGFAASAFATDEESSRLLHAIAWSTGQVATSEDLFEDPRYQTYRELVARHGFGAAAAVPLLHEGQSYGVLSVVTNQAGAFDLEEIALLEEVAHDLALALRGIAEAETRTATERTVEQEKRQLRTLIDNLPDMVYVKDAQSRFVLANDAVAQGMGVSHYEELMGKTDFEFFPPELANRYFHDEQTLIRTGQRLTNVEEPFRMPDGSVRWHLTSKTPLFDAAGGVVGLVGIGRDVTEMKSSREALQQSASRLILLHGIDIAVLAGTPADEIAANALGALAKVIPCWRSSVMVLGVGGVSGTLLAVESRFDAGIPKGTGVAFAEGEMARLALGEVVYEADDLAHPSTSLTEQNMVAAGMRSHVIVPMIAGGGFLGTLNLASDRPNAFSPDEIQIAKEIAGQIAIAIEQHRLREQVASHMAELEERVAARTSELAERENALRTANARLKELDQLKSEFVSNVSHELRTPLNNIKLYLELLRSGMPAKRDRYLDTLDRESNLLQVLIDDLLELSRFDLGRTVLEMQDVDAAQLAEALVEDRRALVESNGLALHMVDHRSPMAVKADPRMLAQVLSNLLTNAVNYTPRGGRITVSAGETASGPGERWVYVSVSDTGFGVAPEEHEHIFERFYRGSAAHSTGSPGTGLGLAICREIIRRHGGRIDLQSTPGLGSTFTVLLPAP